MANTNVLTHHDIIKLNIIMNELLSDPFVRIQNKFSGGFSCCEMFDYDDDFIDIELIFGVQSDCADNVYKEQYKIDRKLMEIVN